MEQTVEIKYFSDMTPKTGSDDNDTESAINDDDKDSEKDSNDDNDTEKDNDDDDNDDDAVKKSHSRLN